MCADWVLRRLATHPPRALLDTPSMGGYAPLACDERFREFSRSLELPAEAENSQPTNQSLTDNCRNEKKCRLAQDRALPPRDGRQRALQQRAALARGRRRALAPGASEFLYSMF